MKDAAAPAIAAPVTDHAPGLERAFSFVPEERSAEPLPVEGKIPSFLRGTYYLNGPARFARAESRSSPMPRSLLHVNA